MTRVGKPPAAARQTRPRCAQADDLWGYLDGELTAARGRAVARHLQTCAGCTAHARRLRAVLDACRAAGCRSLPADVRVRAKARIQALVRKR